MRARSVRIHLAAVLALVVSAVMVSSALAHHPGEQHEASDDPSVAAASVAAQGATSAKCQNGRAGPYPCKNVDLESFLPLPLVGASLTGNDIWGWTDRRTGREYALVGGSDATGFVDVTDPQNPTVVGYLPTRGIPDFILWRDIKVDGNYAFIVSEISQSGLQVFDLRRLRNAGSTPKFFTSDATYDRFSHAHNIAVNEATGYAYVVGSDTCENAEGEDGGLHMVDINDPENPTFAGCALVPEDDQDEETRSINYSHDVQCVIYRGPDADYRGREICFGSNQRKVVIYDVTNKQNPVVISTTGYPTAAYTHQGWLTENQRYFLFGDELDEQEGTVDNTTTYIMNVDDLDNPGAPKAYMHETNSIDHNMYTKNGRVYQSNYMAGLRVLKYRNSSLANGDLNEVAFFDVLPGADIAEFAGTWSNYPYFDSGIVVVSTIEQENSGLFVLRPRFPSDGDGGGGDGGGGGSAPKCRGKSATVVADSGGTTRGTSGNDVIVGTQGDDDIRGRGGDDIVCARQGDDEVRGGADGDRLYGGGGTDLLKGNREADLVAGNGGDDQLRGMRGRDELRGRQGADGLRGGRGRDELRGDKDDDDLRGGQGGDGLDGGDGTDRCRGGGGPDKLRDCEV